MNRDKTHWKKASTLLLMVVLFTATLATAQIISTDKDSYNLNEVVTIKLNSSQLEDKTLRIRAEGKLYTYSGSLSQNLKFRTQKAGKHVVTLEEKTTREVVDKKAFDVTNVATRISGDATIQSSKNIYHEGENVMLRVEAENYENLRIFLIDGDTEMLYMGELTRDMIFPSPKPGGYTLELRDIRQNVLDTTAFTVAETTAEKKEVEPGEPEPQEKVPPKRATPGVTKVKGFRMSQKGTGQSSNVKMKIPGVAKGFEIKGINPSELDNLKVEKLPNEKVRERNVLDAFAVDPTQVSFTEATITRVAKGTELLKCKQWNYTAQRCDGTWENTKNLTPGQEYNISIGPLDPAFAEAGVATVNTRQPIYETNDVVELVMVVLDTKGELVSGADVTLIVTKPNGAERTLRTSTGEITETSTGVYEADYLEANLEGIYDLNVTAESTNVSQEMISYFPVNDSYEFDIIRDTPVTIDPRFEFNSSVEISPRIPFAGQYNYTEVLPYNFTVTDTGGATLTDDGNFKYLTWTGLQGIEKVSYQADAPDIIPNLEVIGPSFIEYSAGVYEEARPWYVAIDPTLTDQAISTNTSTVDQDNTVLVTGNLFCSGGGPSIDYDVWVEDDGTQIDTTSSGRDFSCGGAGDVTITLCEAGSCTVNADCSVSVTTCGNNDDIDIEWTLTADGNDEPLDSNNTLGMDASISNSLDNTADVIIQSTVTDNTGPAVVLSYPSNGASIDNDDMNFKWNATDNIDTSMNCDLRIDGTVEASAVISQNNTIVRQKEYGLATGSHDWNVTCIDDNGNSNTSSTRTFTVNDEQDSALEIYKVTDIIFPSTVTSASGNGPLRSVFNIWNPNDEERNLTEVLDNYTAADNIVDSLTDTSPVTGWTVTDGDVQWTESQNITAKNYTIMRYGFWVTSDLGAGPSWTGGQLNSSDRDEEGLIDRKGYTGFNNPKEGVPWILTEVSVDNSTFDYSINANASLSQDFYTRFGDFSCVGSIDTSVCSVSLTLALESGWSVDSCGQGAEKCTDSEIRWTNISANGFTDTTCGLPAEYFGTTYRFTGSPPSVSENDATVIDATLHYCDSGGNTHDTVGEHLVKLQVNNITPPSLTINEPNDAIATYTYSGITSPSSTQRAYEGNATGLPPISANAPITGTEATTSQYSDISSRDDNRWQTTISNSGSVHAYHSFRFKVDESSSDITDLFFAYEGFATSKNTQDADPFNIYIYNSTADSYQLLETVAGSTTDVFTEVNLQDGFSDYLSGGEVYFLVEGQFTTGGGANARADLHTDFARLEISSIPAIGGSASPINTTAADVDGVDACQYRIYNSTNEPVSFTGMEDLGSDIWYNTSDTTSIPDGRYTVQVRCNDTIGNFNNETIVVDIFNAAPTTFPVSPANDTNYTATNNVSFVWNATDPRGGSLDCDLYLDGSLNRSITLDSGNTANETVNGIPDGEHLWNVTCTASTGLANSTETRVFRIDTTGPSVNLEDPQEDYATTLFNISFLYNVSDANPIPACSLYINDLLNQTNNSITRDTSQNFTTTDFAEGYYNWSVSCDDQFNRTTLSEIRNFTVDRTLPSVFLNTSGGINFSNGTAELNWTPIDNLDPVLTCNATVSGTVEASDVASNNDTLTSRNISLSDGTYFWNVTCTDEAGNTNTSETRNFSVVGPPLVTLNQPPNNAYDQGTFVNFNYTVDDGDGISNCTFVWDGTDNQTRDGSNITNGGSNLFNLSNINEGEHNWTVSCTDTAGGSRAADPFNITIDRTAPNISLLSPNNGDNTTNGNMTFNFTVTDNIDPSLTCDLAVSDHTVDPANTGFEALNGSLQSKNETSLSDGVKYWNVTCTDEASNTFTSATRNFTVFGSPVVTLGDPLNGSFESGTLINFTYNTSDVNGVDSCEFIFDGSVNQTDNNPSVSSLNIFNLSSVAEGAYLWSVNCTDTTEQEGSSEERTVIVDDTSPSINALDPNGTTFNQNTITFNFTATDNLDSTLACDVNVDNGTHTNSTVATNGSTTTVGIGNVSEGFHEWNVTCDDGTPNTGFSQTLNFSIDASPVVNITRPANDTGSTTGNLTFYYQVTDTGLSSCSLIFDGAVNQTRTAAQIPHNGNGLENNFTLNNTAQGEYNWTVNCTDNNGFTGTDTPRIIYTDFEAPNTTLDSPDQNATLFINNVFFNWTVLDNVDPVLSCDLRINGFANQTGLNSQNGSSTQTNVTFQSPGNYTWSVNCTDSTGFWNLSETRNFTLESQPKVTLVDPAQNDTKSSSDLVFTYVPASFVGFDGIAFCEFFFDGTSADTTFPPNIENGEENNFTRSGISQGDHFWQVNCTDADGAVAQGGPVNFTVDLTAPNVDLNAPNGTTLSTSTIEFNWTATDNLADEMLCNVTVNNTLQSPQDIASLNNTPTTQSIGGFDDGLHLWNTTCSDGGLTNSSGTFNFTVEEPPIIALGSPDNATRTSNTTLDLFYTPTDNSGSVASCELLINSQVNQTNSSINNSLENNFTVSGFGDGTYDWNVNCTDPRGNEGKNDTPQTFFIDLTGPNISLNYPPGDAVLNNNNITFNWTATDFTNTFVSCTLRVTDTPSNRNASTNETSGTDHLASVSNLTDGDHTWNVTCADDLGNTAFSGNQNFTINQPDLATSDGNLTFNNTNPDVDENITVLLNVSNIGGNPANNILVEFWDGEIGVGTFIGNTTINVLVNETVVANTSWLIPRGAHTINAYVDPNNTQEELVETNNNATQTLTTLISNLTAPPSGTNTSDTTPTINFTLEDFTGGSIGYDIFIDGSANGQSGTVTDGDNTTLDLTALSEGVHTVFVRATDGLGRVKDSNVVTITVDTTAPQTSFVTQNNSFYNTPNASIDFNMTDATSTSINYTLYLDGTANSSGTASNGTTVTEELTGLSEGQHNIIIEATDELGNTGNSSTLSIFIDFTNPVPSIETQDSSWFNTATPTINFNITDNLDSTLNYTLYADGAADATGTVANATSSSDTLSALTEGSHSIVLEGLDDAGNDANSTATTINIDLTAPNVTLLAPANDTNLTTTSVEFNFTVSDNLDGQLVCDLRIDGTVEENNLNVTNGTISTNVLNQPSGTHFWNVTCLDEAGNNGVSQTYEFFIESPDIVVNNVTFNDTSVIEGDNVTVTANISNDGNLDANNVTVQFWLGDPDFLGSQINGDKTITSLPAGDSVILQVNHTAVIGVNQIFAIADPPLSTNGSIVEENESNNEFNNSFRVGHYNVVAGDTVDILEVTDDSFQPLYTWNVSDATGSNVFVADTDSNIEFTQLQAIGRDTSNASSSQDFEEIDVELNSTSFNDSVNNTWTSGGNPIDTRTFNVFAQDIQNVPVVNSTNTVDFQTGLLWDTSDGGSQYNGTQDLLLITEINEGQTGQFGTYDYEVKIPATMRDYISGTSSVTFYTEIK